MAAGVHTLKLSAHVWPVYVGVATDDPGPPPVAAYEPFDDVDYKRGMVWWATSDDGMPVGSARIHMPKGEYRYLLYCRGPHREGFQSAQKMEHPFRFDDAGFMDVTVGDHVQLPNF